jgi:putative ABC transport system permease protein
LAVLKVLGYRPVHLVILVLGEAVLIGAISGVISAGLTYYFTSIVGQSNDLGPLIVPIDALWWGPALGAATAILGCTAPALSGCRVKVAEVFSKVA